MTCPWCGGITDRRYCALRWKALAGERTGSLAGISWPFVYPEDGEVVPASYAVVNDDVEILVRTVPVGHGGVGFAKLESRLGAAAQSILDELILARAVPDLKAVK